MIDVSDYTESYKKEIKRLTRIFQLWALCSLFLSICLIITVMNPDPVLAAKRAERTETNIQILTPMGQDCWLVGTGAEEMLELIGTVTD